MSKLEEQKALPRRKLFKREIDPALRACDATDYAIVLGRLKRKAKKAKGKR